LDSISYPDFEGFEFEKYLDRMHPNDQYFYDLFDEPRVYPIICSRSCPFLCTFCFHPVGNRYRQRSVNSIMAELSIMVNKYRINTIAIYDELFSNNREWLYDFCRRFKKFSEGLTWVCRWSCQMRVDKLDDEMLKIMKDAGCYMISYGFESYSPSVLKSMKKHITPIQIERAVETTLKNNISIQGNFIFGDSAETVETANETLSFWKKHNSAGIMLSFINPYPGTELYEHCLKKGIIKDKLDFIANHIFDVFNMSDTMTDEEFEKLKFDIHEAELKYRMCAVPSIKKRADGTFNVKVKCPHCSEVMEYKNYLLSQKLYFIFLMYCRQCRRRFFIVSELYRIASVLQVTVYSVISVKIKLVLNNFINRLIRFKPYIKKYILRFIG
ncbi:MAG: radical SAM protein, partial [Elusimicrobiota bacterium]|nr:radical SAM protein [Elusimicrobiota bacterium]